MIYEFPPASANIRQGDIFIGLPRIDLSLSEVVLANEIGESVVKWDDIATKGEPVNIIVPARPVAAIVITQDCDAMRSRDVSLCEIRSFRDVERKGKDTSSAKSWKNLITQHARLNLKWFYLPPDERVGFSEKMAADFMVTLRVPRVDLEELKSLRTGRLNAMADEHFRERLSDFYRRYPYDEWYPLDNAELKAYRDEYPGAEPFPWQEAAATVFESKGDS
ncbi:MAG: hypothetical protein ACOY4F_11010 [Thermodesulfobacteriota bacterium]